MRRTPPWVFVAAAGIELAVLLLCVWGMEQSPTAVAEQPAEALPPAFPELELPREPEPETEQEPEPEPLPNVHGIAPLPPGPMFGPPPERPPEAYDCRGDPGVHRRGGRRRDPDRRRTRR